MNDARRVSAFIVRRDWFLEETKEKRGGSSSDTDDPSILALLIPPSSTRLPDAMIDIILPSLWLQRVSFPSSVRSVFYLSPNTAVCQAVFAGAVRGGQQASRDC